MKKNTINLNYNDIKVVITVISIRKSGNEFKGNYEVSLNAPILEGEGYEIRPNPFGEGISVFVGGKELRTFVTGRKIFAKIALPLYFDTKEQAEEAVAKLRQHKDEFIQMYNNKKVNMAAVKAMVA